MTLRPRRRGLCIVRDDFFIQNSLSLILFKSNPLRWASIWFYETLSFGSFNDTLISPPLKSSISEGGFSLFIAGQIVSAI